MGAAPRSADLRDDSIVALATAPGRGALALVRVSGAASARLAARCLTLAQGSWPPPPRRAVRARLHHPDRPDLALDDALVTWFPGPASFTGEDVLECTVHGGAYVGPAVVAAFVAAGARPALPGEFTERAVLQGKLDLLRAEAIGDLIDARTTAAHRAALRQLDGAMTHRLDALRSAILDVEALIAYDLDFPAEDDGPLPRARVLAAADDALAALDALLATRPQAVLGRDGVTVVLAGAPNAGKSSLFNALLGESRAIVSEVPGTTRDAIEVLLDDDPWPIRLVDTAGLRDTGDALERLGMEVSARRLAEAQVVVVCGETPEALAAAAAHLDGLTTARRVAALTKQDVPSAGEATPSAIAVSAVTGHGLAALRDALRAAVRAATPDPAESLPVVVQARHAAMLTQAHAELAAFRAAWAEDALPAPVAATHLRAAAHALDELLGAIDVDEVLARVFRTFCVGK